MFKKKNSAFSFVEVIVAAIIVNIAILGCFGAFFYCKAKVQSTKRQVMALNFAQEEMERLMSLQFSDSDLSNGNHNTNTLPTGVETGELRNYWSGTRTYRVQWGPNDYGNAQRYKIITVTVNWTEPSI
ncbi:MAG: hypothetical protein FJZ16_06495 [Candidatus Omnitrophica bacterium]|nr:hypothetical protein [Candidatus Omnitrophota bacterium]